MSLQAAAGWRPVATGGLCGEYPRRRTHTGESAVAVVNFRDLGRYFAAGHITGINLRQVFLPHHRHRDLADHPRRSTMWSRLHPDLSLQVRPSQSRHRQADLAGSDIRSERPHLPQRRKRVYFSEYFSCYTFIYIAPKHWGGWNCRNQVLKPSCRFARHHPRC